jgi:hypothetical protein
MSRGDLSSRCATGSSSCLAAVVFSLSRALIALSRRLVVVSPLVASPSHPLVAPPHSRPIVLLSLHRPLVASSCWQVVASPLVATPSCLLVAPPTLVLSLSSHCATRSLPRHAGWLLRHLSPRRRRLILSSCCRTLVQPLSSHCAAFSSPHRFDGTGIGGIRGCVLLADQGPEVGLLLGLNVRRERC